MHCDVLLLRPVVYYRFKMSNKRKNYIHYNPSGNLIFFVCLIRETAMHINQYDSLCLKQKNTKKPFKIEPKTFKKPPKRSYQQ